MTSGAGPLELFALLRAAGYQLYLRGPAIGGAKLIRADADAATCATTLCDFAAYLTRHETECGVRSHLLVDA